MLLGMSEPDRHEPMAAATARLIRELAQIVAAQQDRIEALEERLDSRRTPGDTQTAPPLAHQQSATRQP